MMMESSSSSTTLEDPQDWTVLEKLLLTQSLLKTGIETTTSWNAASQILQDKTETRPRDFFSSEHCAVAFTKIVGVEPPETAKKRLCSQTPSSLGAREDSLNTLGENLKLARINELRSMVHHTEALIRKMKEDISSLKSGKMDEWLETKRRAKLEKRAKQTEQLLPSSNSTTTTTTTTTTTPETIAAQAQTPTPTPTPTLASIVTISPTPIIPSTELLTPTTNPPSPTPINQKSESDVASAEPIKDKKQPIEESKPAEDMSIAAFIQAELEASQAAAAKSKIPSSLPSNEEEEGEKEDVPDKKTAKKGGTKRKKEKVSKTNRRASEKEEEEGDETEETTTEGAEGEETEKKGRKTRVSPGRVKKETIKKVTSPTPRASTRRQSQSKKPEEEEGTTTSVKEEEEEERSRKRKRLSSTQESLRSSSQSVGSDSEKKTSQDQKLLLKLWRSIAQHKYSAVFREPVTLEEAPDYDDVIKQRMDLATLKKKIEDGTVTNTTEFFRDVMLMLQNAMIYNAKDSGVYTMSSTLKQFVLKDMKNYFPMEYETPSRRRKSRSEDTKEE